MRARIGRNDDEITRRREREREREKKKGKKENASLVSAREKH